ncbi:chlorocatechol-degradation protein [Lanmaoa asiatica]|nr:chlorocatechol-degradation protein [Lanmaoa asiatica]
MRHARRTRSHFFFVTGKVEVINGVKTYVATPTIDYPKDKAILFLPDIFGIELINSQLLADDFARNGFQVYVVDYLNGDALPPDIFNSGTFDLFKWLKEHGQDVTRPPLDKVITGLKERGVTQFAATGYCFGGKSARLIEWMNERVAEGHNAAPGRYTFDLAFDKVIKVAAVAHPSLLKVPEDLHRYKETGIPLLINSCETDWMFPTEAQAQADVIIGGGSKTSELYQREYFAGCAHGFAVRGDLSIPEVKAGKERAFEVTVEFFLKHL